MSTLLDSLPGSHPDDFEIAVALGTVDKWDIVSFWNEQGSVAQTQEEMSNIASGIRTLPTSGSAITIASSSAEDGAGTSTGALTVLVEYLTSDYSKKSEIITLNGTSDATSTETDAFRFRSAVVLTTGSAGAAVGNISITIDGNVQARILATQNESRETGYTVPKGKIYLLYNVVVAGGRAGNVDVDLAVEVRRSASSPWITLRSLQVYQDIHSFNAVAASTLTEGAEIRILVTASGGAGPDFYFQHRGYEIGADSVRL